MESIVTELEQADGVWGKNLYRTLIRKNMISASIAPCEELKSINLEYPQVLLQRVWGITEMQLAPNRLGSLFPTSSLVMVSLHNPG